MLPFFLVFAFAAFPGDVSAHRCADALQQQLDQWQVTGEVFQAPYASDGSRVLRLPTRAFGVWVAIHVGATLDAYLVSAEGTQRVHWSETCARTLQSVPGRESDSAASAYADAELASEVGSGRGGVLFVWSPHMPFSVAALKSAQEAARELGLHFIPVLDPRADRRYAREVARREDLDVMALRPTASVEIEMRGMLVHSPSLLLYSRGRILGPMIPGARDVRGYRRIFEEILGP